MKTTDRVPFAGTVETVHPDTGEIQAVPVNRTVRAEVERLRYAGMHDAADRLERSCDDAPGLPKVNTAAVLGRKEPTAAPVPA